MTSIEMIEFIDEFLRDQEDVLHGIEGRNCTKSRKYLEDIKEQLSIHGVLKSLPEWQIYQKAQELDEKEFEQWMYDNQ